LLQGKEKLRERNSKWQLGDKKEELKKEKGLDQPTSYCLLFPSNYYVYVSFSFVGKNKQSNKIKIKH